MKKEQKKGQLAGLAMVIITLVIAAVAIFLGIQLLGGFQTITDDYSATITNESTGFINQSGYTLTGASTVSGFNNPIIVLISNKSNGVTIASGNYTLVGNTIYNATATVWTAVNVTYTYNYGQGAYVASNKSIVGTASFTDFWSLIVLAVVITIVIGLILAVMSSRKVK